MAVMEKIGRESGAYVSMIRTDMKLLTKAAVPGTNVKTLDYFDAIFYMGEGPWKFPTNKRRTCSLSSMMMARASLRPMRVTAAA